MINAITATTYIAAAACFILSLKWLNRPATARKGVRTGEVGMVLAIAGTLVHHEIVSYTWIIVAFVIGTIIGYPLSRVPMTAVPQRTALSHSFGGLGAGLVGTAEYFLNKGHLSSFTMGAIVLEILLGFITFTGSLMAAGKLQEVLPQRPIVYKGQNVINLSLFAIALASGIYLITNSSASGLFILIVVLALIFGVLLIIPIGGADMPTVISLLNSYAGLSASAMGFVLGNKLLIVAGALDGSSGLILSIIMCKAMNRSFTNVLFGAFGQVAAAGPAAKEERPVRSAIPEEAASILEAASSVIIVPGYGMAVAQAQHKVRELYDTLTKQGVDVRFAIHPVAGRMPGHMNVLLAEADIPYEKLIDMDDINSEFAQCDVALIIGANDVTNPAAKTDPQSPIYGMPILDVERAQTVLFVKRGMASGYAGVDNELFFRDNTMMLFADAKVMCENIVKALEGSAH